MSNELTHIKDIGESREKWLNEHGIYTYSDLASVDANWLYERFKHEGKPTPLKLINSWIEAAKNLLTEERSNLEVNTDTNVIPFQRSTDMPPITEDGWEEFASFYVSYQHKRQVGHFTSRTQVSYRTYADHIEANDNQQWEGIEGDDLCRWIMNHVDKIIYQEGHGEPLGFGHTTMIGDKVTSSELVIEGMMIQNDNDEVMIGTAGTSLQRVLNSCYPIIIIPILSVSHTKADFFNWKGKIILYISKMPNGYRSLLQSQQQNLHFSNVAEVYHRHGFQSIELSPGLYRIQVVLWTDAPFRKLASSKEYIVQMV